MTPEGRKKQVGLGNAVMLWHTPVGQDDGKTPEAHLAMKARMKGGPRTQITSLQVEVKALWPTPYGNASTGAGTQGRDGGVNLQTAVWPTPQASDGEKGGPNMRHGTGDQALPGVCSNPSFTATSGTIPSWYGVGQLNPNFVCWLMGFPDGWLS